MFRNNKLRLLMKLLGFERLGDEDVLGASWAIPSALTSNDIRVAKRTVDACLASPITDYKGEDLLQLLRTKNRGRRGGEDQEESAEVNFGSDSEGEEEVPEGLLFPPNPRAKAGALDRLKEQRRKRKKDTGQGEERLSERRRQRLVNTLARQVKIKSDLYIHASDEESDDEADQAFFLAEEQRRKMQSERIRQALLGGDEVGAEKGDKNNRKRKSKDANGLSTTDVEAKRPRSSHEGTESDDDNSVTAADDDSSVSDAGGLLPSLRDVLSPGPDAEKAGNASRPPADEDDLDFDDDLAFGRDRHVMPAADPEEAHNQQEEAGSLGGRIEGGFVIGGDSSDSE